MPATAPADYRSRFNDSEWQALSYAPAIVFALVAGADGVIDKKEIESFKVQIVKTLAFDSGLLRAIMVQELSRFTALFDGIYAGTIEPADTLLEIAAIIEAKLSADEAGQFRAELLMIGRYVAEASGGFLGLFGSKVSKAEQQALDFLKTHLQPLSRGDAG